MTTQPTRLFDRRAGGLVEATLHLSLTPERLVQAEQSWGPHRHAAISRLIEAGTLYERFPEHWHWDWARKAANLGLPGYRCIGIECEGLMQGLMMVVLAGRVARLSPEAGEPVVYVDYVESAPWNVRPFAEEPRYGAVGYRLITGAVAASVEAGFGGRVGLHSLPQSVAFYENACGMANLGVDSEYQSLHYLEFSRANAERFLEQERF